MAEVDWVQIYTSTCNAIAAVFNCLAVFGSLLKR
jgi:hypothetical protein